MLGSQWRARAVKYSSPRSVELFEAMKQTHETKNESGSVKQATTASRTFCSGSHNLVLGVQGADNESKGGDAQGEQAGGKTKLKSNKHCLLEVVNCIRSKQETWERRMASLTCVWTVG